MYLAILSAVVISTRTPHAGSDGATNGTLFDG